MSKFALIGEKLGHSYSGIVHKRFFELTSRNEHSYELIEIPRDSLEEEFKKISQTYRGINVTIPYKTEVMSYLTYISPEAEKMGAVNTISFSDGGIKGYNTDYLGFGETLKQWNIDPKGKRVVILGTGGASKSALGVCRDMGAKSISFVSSSGKAVGEYETLTYSDNIEGDILINCTPVGMYPNTDKSPLEQINFEVVADMIYNPGETELIKRASANGSKCVNGLYMLISQALHSEAIWQGESYREDIARIIYDELKIKF